MPTSWTGEKVAEIVNGSLCGDGTATVHGCVLDSRKAKKGQMFFALSGAKADGHAFIGTAWEKGADIVIGEKDKITRWQDSIPPGKGLILVESAYQALRQCAEAWVDELGCPVVGITGSNGKTTTKDMISAVLAKKYQVYANQENHNNELGLPMTILNAPADTEILVLEMGMRCIGQIRELCQIARPKIGVITNIGTTHMELLGSQENIAQAKWELINALPESGVAVLNAEDEWSVRKGKEDRHNSCFYGTAGLFARPHVQGKDLKPAGLMGTSFKVLYQNEECTAVLPLPGEHNVLDALAALTVGVLFDIPLAIGCEGLKDFQLSKMRLEIFPGIYGSTLVSDVYNANPISMQASLKVLRERGREHYTLAILGDMYELGDQAAEGHREAGRTVSSLKVDELIVVGELAREIAVGAVEQGYKENRVHICRDRAEALDKGKAVLTRHPQAWVLIKGSRGMKMEEITTGLMERNSERNGKDQ